jgi:TnpA family transposase
MLQRDGRPTAIGEAIAASGRIFKSLHILNYIDLDESYRRDIKGIQSAWGEGIAAVAALVLLIVIQLQTHRRTGTPDHPGQGSV